MNAMPVEQAVKSAAALLRSSERGVVLTGAGVSTPSGIPDFRSLDSGLWHRFNPFEVASLTAFRHAPERFFAWIRPLASQIFEAKPNSAHYSLAQLETAGLLHGVITQNVDGLHQRAGSQRVCEVHGSMDNLTCVSCYQIVRTVNVIDLFIQKGTIPRCPECDGILKPNVILFEEQLPLEPWNKARELLEGCDFLLIAGTSLEVVPVSGLPWIAMNRGTPLVIVNRTETPLNDRADVAIGGDVAEIIPMIAEEVLGG